MPFLYEGEHPMSVIVILTLVVKQNLLDEFISFLNRTLPDTRGYQGCIKIHMYRHQDNKQQITFIEEWESKQHYQNYFNWRSETGALAKIMSLCEGELSITYLDKLN